VINPGHTALTRTCGASVRAKCSVIALTAPFDAM
jgi:hypothetical protein